MTAFAAALALFLPLGRSLIAGLTPAIGIFAAAPAFAREVVYRQCDIYQDLIVIDKSTGEVFREVQDLPTTYKIDIENKEITAIVRALSSTSPFELQDRTLHIMLDFGDSYSSNDILTIQLDPPGEVSMKNQVSNEYANSIVVTRGVCNKVNASVYEEADALRLKIAESSDLMTSCWEKKNVGDFKEAILDCNEAIRLNPQNYYAYTHRGNAKYFLGDLKGVCKDWRKSVKLGGAEANALGGISEAATRVENRC